MIKRWLQEKLGILEVSNELALTNSRVNKVASDSERSKQHITLLAELTVNPKALKVSNIGLTWKSKNWNKSKKTWTIMHNRQPGESDSQMLKSIAENISREQD